jgi:hypothetical protein
MKTTVLILAMSATAQAGSRSSADYTIAADTVDGGGRRATSAAYSNDGSAGAVAGVSTVASPAETVKHGYLAQVTDVNGLTLTAASPNVDEGANIQLATWQILDDATFLAVPAASVAWSVVSGPLAGISGGGIATASLVFQETTATAQAAFRGDTGSLTLTVRDTVPDNFGSYAGDGIGDDWQVQYFGQDNPLAAPLLDPDGDGQMNAFEFTAGLVPNDAASRFTLTIAPGPGQPTPMRLTFSPRLPSRTYTVKVTTNLSTGGFLPLADASAPIDNGQERTITDLSATGSARFYRVEITKP